MISKTFRYVNALGGELIFDYAHGFLLNLPDGVDTMSVKLSTAQGINQVGATVQAKQIQVRPITVSGRIVGKSAQAIKDSLVSVVRADVSGTLYADDWKIGVVVTATPTIGPEPFGAAFQFSVTAPYPYWESNTEKGSMVTGITPGFRFPWNISRPYRFGTRAIGQYVVVPNKGQTDVPFVVEIVCLGASASNVRIDNILTREYLLLEKSLVEGEVVTINVTHDRTYVTSSVDGDCRGALTLESNLFRLHTGDNVWKASAGSGINNLDIGVTYAEESGGITVV